MIPKSGYRFSEKIMLHAPGSDATMAGVADEAPIGAASPHNAAILGPTWLA